MDQVEINEHIFDVPLTPEECFNLDVPLEEEHRKGKDSRTWGKNVLEDSTKSGVGGRIHELLSDKPTTREWKKLQDWKKELEELYEKYNELVGFEAFGKDFD